MKECRDCKHQVSEQAYTCPNCGALHPAKPKWDGQVVRKLSAVLGGF